MRLFQRREPLAKSGVAAIMREAATLLRAAPPASPAPCSALLFRPLAPTPAASLHGDLSERSRW